MRKTRFIENCRCYHLISRLAHQAFFLNDDEKTWAVKLECGNPAVAERILELLAEDGPMRPSALRKAVGIRSSIHFNRYYLSPLLERGIIARIDPDHPQSPQQRYCLT